MVAIKSALRPYLSYKQKDCERVSYIEQVLPVEKKQKEYGHFVRTPFHTPCLARYSVLYLIGVMSGGNIASLV